MKTMFNEYIYMKAEIKRLLSEDTTATDVVRGSSVEAPYTQHTIRVSGIDSQYARWIRERIETLQDRCATVEKVIANAPNSLIRLILIYRYQDGMDWEQVGKRLPKQRSGDACRKVAERYLDGLEG